jgi:hypothetical protein
MRDGRVVSFLMSTRLGWLSLAGNIVNRLESARAEIGFRCFVITLYHRVPRPLVPHGLQSLEATGHLSVPRLSTPGRMKYYRKYRITPYPPSRNPLP